MLLCCYVSKTVANSLMRKTLRNYCCGIFFKVNLEKRRALLHVLVFKLKVRS